jgi:hypothetical protein
MIVYRAVLSFVISLAFGTTAAFAAGSPIKVERCEVSPGQTTVSGFSPAYYPAGPYYWRDPYGYRYHQYAYPTSVHTSNPSLAIEYVNVTANPIKEIEFGLVARGDLIAEVRDVGTFSQGATIKHSFGLNPNVYPTGSGLNQCVPLRATYENGTVWTNPHLPRLRRSIYE